MGRIEGLSGFGMKSRHVSPGVAHHSRYSLGMTVARAPTAAFAVAAIGIASYSCMDAVMKGMSIGHGAYSAVLWRSVGGVVLMGPVFLVGRRPWPGRRALALHVWRGA